MSPCQYYYARRGAKGLDYAQPASSIVDGGSASLLGSIINESYG